MYPTNLPDQNSQSSTENSQPTPKQYHSSTVHNFCKLANLLQIFSVFTAIAGGIVSFFAAAEFNGIMCLAAFVGGVLTTATLALPLYALSYIVEACDKYLFHSSHSN